MKTKDRDYVIRVLSILLSAALLALIVGQIGFRLGRESGIDHVLSDSTFYTVEGESYTDPLGRKFNHALYIEIDGNVYEQGLYACEGFRLQ